MKTALAVLALVVATATPAAAQDVVVVIDAGPVAVDAAALRAELAEAIDRPVLSLADEASRAADETLTIAHVGADRWVLRHQRGAQVTWVERASVEPSAVHTTLLEAAAALLEPATTFAGAELDSDVMDPFADRWDPLQIALATELHEPFDGGVAHATGELTDPFVEVGADLLFDPWRP